MKAFLVSVFASLVFLSACSPAAEQTGVRVTVSGAYQAELTKCILDAQTQAEYKVCADAVDVRFGASQDAGADR